MIAMNEATQTPAFVHIIHVVGLVVVIITINLGSKALNQLHFKTKQKTKKKSRVDGFISVGLRLVFRIVRDAESSYTNFSKPLENNCTRFLNIILNNEFGFLG